MFKELNDNLTSIEGEITKLKTAIDHIDAAKVAAQSAVNAANSTNTEFKNHLVKVTQAVDSILKPHQDLITATEKLTKTIEAINFPKQLKLIKIITIATFVVVIIGSLLILVLPYLKDK
jgi:chromosome segregation ATPase